MNNKVNLMGTVEAEPVYSHELYGEGFYEFFLAVPRLSQYNDVLPITVSERIKKDADLTVGSKIALIGQFRSHNEVADNKSKLILTVFVEDFVPLRDEQSDPNIVELTGYICKPPIYRATPFGREICDMLLAVNRAYNKSDYIPCIAWGRNARFVSTIEVGQMISVAGRIQSRQYNKKQSDDTVETRTAYEVSIGKIALIGDLTTLNEKETKI